MSLNHYFRSWKYRVRIFTGSILLWIACLSVTVYRSLLNWRCRYLDVRHLFQNGSNQKMVSIVYPMFGKLLNRIDFQTMKTDPKIFTLSADSTLLHGGKLVPKFEYVAGHTLRIVGDTSCRDFFTFMMDHAHKLTLKSSFVGIALAPFQFVGGQLRQNKVTSLFTLYLWFLIGWRYRKMDSSVVTKLVKSFNHTTSPSMVLYLLHRPKTLSTSWKLNRKILKFNFLAWHGTVKT